MKVTVRDPSILNSLRPLDVAAYLRSSGWSKVEQIGDKGSVWSRPSTGGDEYEILLPLRRDLGDFTARMADALTTIEAAEQRSQLEILHDLTTASADVIRIRTQHPDTSDGTIPIEAGVSMVQRAREMMLAVACSAVQPRAYFHARRPIEVAEYMGKLRLGQQSREAML